MAKKDKAADKKNGSVELEQFKGKDENGKVVKVSAPKESLDEDGNAESALQGVYRSC